MEPLVSVVYLTKNGGSIFEKSLKAVFSQKVEFGFEVIAIDSGSADGTVEIIQSHPVRLYQILPHEFNFGLTRDYGFSLAKGALVVVISQDAVPVGEQWLHDLISPFADDSVSAVQGMDVLPQETELFYWDKVRLFYHTRDCQKWMNAYNNIGMSFTCCAIRRSAWEGNQLGRVEMSEDKVFQKKLSEKGCKIVFRQEAQDYHSHMYTVRSLAKRCENEGLGWRSVGISYTFHDMLCDIFKRQIGQSLLVGVRSGQIKSLSEFLFPIIRPVFLFKGNVFTEKFAK